MCVFINYICVCVCERESACGGGGGGIGTICCALVHDNSVIFLAWFFLVCFVSILAGEVFLVLIVGFICQEI